MATGYVTVRLQPRDGNGAVLRQYQDAGGDTLSAGSYIADGVTLPNIYAIQNGTAAAATGTFRGNNESLNGVPQANTVDIAFSIVPGGSLYGDFTRVTFGVGTLRLYKKLLP